MFENYLNDEQVYYELEQYWDSLFFSVNDSSSDEWIAPYYNTYYNNGLKFMDANPIFSAKSKVTDKSIKIIQEPLEELDSVQYWIDSNEKNELVIICSFSEENILAVKKLIKKWLKNLLN
ncbi:hypothetical protein FE392_02605 [Xenorhabdus sp. 12]|uniref:CdiI C-terminal domain-containing protein n=1 Tax=Xenorhabdus santafensis TaxID=2582833 RepID=A0ABU4S4T9_9GAMM|nr:hypothetical protein [Xenorhabdus sp. 12]MDX7986227.1 hypothetical protein [Xenorhabdus sp. 12]